MINRAKCFQCNSVIESIDRRDDVTCVCGCIGVYGGDLLYCRANDWGNFLRVDDEGNTIAVTHHITTTTTPPSPSTSLEEHQVDQKNTVKFNDVEISRLLDMLDAMSTAIEQLPQHAMLMPINHYDFASLLLLLSSILRLQAGHH